MARVWLIKERVRRPGCSSWLLVAEKIVTLRCLSALFSTVPTSL